MTSASPCRSFHSFEVTQNLGAGEPPRLQVPEGLSDQALVAVDGRAVEVTVADLRRSLHGFRDRLPREPVGPEGAEAHGGHLRTRTQGARRHTTGVNPVPRHLKGAHRRRPLDQAAGGSCDGGVILARTTQERAEPHWVRIVVARKPRGQREVAAAGSPSTAPRAIHIGPRPGSAFAAILCRRSRRRAAGDRHEARRREAVIEHPSRRQFLRTAAGAAAGVAAGVGEGAGQAAHVAIVVDPADTVASSGPARWAAGELERQLAERGLSVRVYPSAAQAPAASLRIVAAGMASPGVSAGPRGRRCRREAGSGRPGTVPGEGGSLGVRARRAGPRLRAS